MTNSDLSYFKLNLSNFNIFTGETGAISEFLLNENQKLKATEPPV
jgi:hypothetical protein